MISKTVPQYFVASIDRDFGLQVIDDLLGKEVVKSAVNVLGQHPGYTLSFEYDCPDHRWGYGGEYEHRTILKKLGDPVLLSVHYHSYSTSSDDFEDYTSEHSYTTYLLAEDPLASSIFDRLRSLSAEVRQ